MSEARFDLSQLDFREASRRRHWVLTVLLLLGGPAIVTMADLHWRTGYDAWKVGHLVLFAVLLLLVALGASQSLFGYFLRRNGGDPCRIIDTLGPDDGGAIAAPTAVVMPICNEDVDRVMDGVRSIYDSLRRNGRLSECHLFILSDSSDPNCWVAEEAAWLALTRQLGAHGRIFYRKRRGGINKKAGNLADFCRRWGKLYRYMVVLDADSIISGDAIVRLVQLMERNPRVGIIQGVPILANAETLLGRLQQFASRLYGPISAEGLNYWQLSEANYWGHNAIIRLAPFIRHCSLPELPGGGAFGGRILSHDYVEAALMRRAGWEVWLAKDLEGNYEECPATLIELAKRDRRWLQGNLQHARLVVARGFYTVNRIHFILGILAYAASPLWFAFLIISMVIAARFQAGATQGLPDSGFAAYMHWSYRGEALSLFVYTLVLLFVPKMLALLDLRHRPGDVPSFGGWGAVGEGVVLETVIFTFLAPILMVFHSWYILLALIGKKVPWRTQKRGTESESAWTEQVRAHGAQTVLGLAGTAIGWQVDPLLTLWMSPVLLGLIFSIPLSYLTGSVPLGQALRRRGVFVTPEESRPTKELTELARSVSSHGAAPRPLAALAENYGLLQAVIDPYVNAVHVALLHARDDLPPTIEKRFAALRTTLLQEGPEALSPGDRMALLNEAGSMRTLHTQLWSTPAAHLADWWRLALEHYSRFAPAPQTPFNS